jgi:hypothetical protein
MKTPALKTELSKLLREQQALLEDKDSHPSTLDRNNYEVWTLRNKYLCAPPGTRDPAFDKWWTKQVVKARNLNQIRQIAGYAAIALFFIWWIYSERCAQENRREYLKTHPDAEEVQSDDN